MFPKIQNFVVFVFLVAIQLNSPYAIAKVVDHSVWDTLLKSHVVVKMNGAITSVNYADFKKNRDKLNTYLKTMASVSQQAFDRMSKDEQLAMLINVYNATTIELILTGYPDIQSIKDLGAMFSSPWKKEIVSLFGKQLSLDDLEHGLIRGSRYQDPRIHFAVNCASIGCPALRAEAYVGERLQAQLDDQAHLFLSDKSRNRFVQDALEVSYIFKWYREDFEKGWKGIHSLQQFFSQYQDTLHLDIKQLEALNSGRVYIKFLDYDWFLNDVKS